MSTPLTTDDSIDALADVDTTTTSPTVGQVLGWDMSAGKWVPIDRPAGGFGVTVAVGIPYPLVKPVLTLEVL
jgi:hypothetical protein